MESRPSFYVAKDFSIKMKTKEKIENEVPQSSVKFYFFLLLDIYKINWKLDLYKTWYSHDSSNEIRLNVKCADSVSGKKNLFLDNDRMLYF